MPDVVEIPDEFKHLPPQEAIFCVHLIENSYNRATAARLTGYGNENSPANYFSVQGKRVYDRPRVRSALHAFHMNRRPSFGTALNQVGELAMVTMDDFLDDEEKMDLKKARDAGAMIAVKEIEFFEDGSVKKVKLVDPLQSRVQLARLLVGAYTEGNTPLTPEQIQQAARQYLEGRLDLDNFDEAKILSEIQNLKTDEQNPRKN